MKLHVLHHSDGDYVKKSVYTKIAKERNALLLENAQLEAKLKIAIQALKDLQQPCTRTDYTIGKLDYVVTSIASDALNDIKEIK